MGIAFLILKKDWCVHMDKSQNMSTFFDSQDEEIYKISGYISPLV